MHIGNTINVTTSLFIPSSHVEITYRLLDINTLQRTCIRLIVRILRCRTRTLHLLVLSAELVRNRDARMPAAGGDQEAIPLMVGT